MILFKKLSILLIVLTCCWSCFSNAVGFGPNPQIREIKFKVVRSYPHDPKAFIQGLVYQDGILYESTGQYGTSEVRMVDLKTGKVLKKKKIASHFFGEGIVVYKDLLFQLTWMSGQGFIYNKKTLKKISSFKYPYPLKLGWGATYDGTNIIISDGTPKLTYINPEDLSYVKTIEVRSQTQPVHNLNELEYIDGAIFANIWQSAVIVKIDPPSGQVIGYINLASLVPSEFKNHADNVLNGIAYDPKTKHLFVTGKMWKKLYEIKIEDD